MKASVKKMYRPEEKKKGAKMLEKIKHYFGKWRRLHHLPSQNIWLQTAKIGKDYE